MVQKVMKISKTERVSEYKAQALQKVSDVLLSFPSYRTTEQRDEVG